MLRARKCPELKPGYLLFSPRIGLTIDEMKGGDGLVSYHPVVSEQRNVCRHVDLQCTNVSRYDVPPKELGDLSQSITRGVKELITEKSMPAVIGYRFPMLFKGLLFFVEITNIEYQKEPLQELTINILFHDTLEPCIYEHLSCIQDVVKQLEYRSENSCIVSLPNNDHLIRSFLKRSMQTFDAACFDLRLAAHNPFSIEKRIITQIEELADSQSKMILISHADMLCLVQDAHRYTQQLIDACSQNKRQVVFIDCSESKSMLSHLVQCSLSLRPLTEFDRGEAVKVLFHNNPTMQSYVHSIAAATPGYTHRHLERLARECMYLFGTGNGQDPSENVVQMAMRHILLDHDTAAVKHSSPDLDRLFGGYQPTVARINAIISHWREMSIVDSKAAALRVPCKGILLYGPPGCGKTMLAHQIANKPGINVVFLNAYVCG